jgi:metal-dependent amidase/aminoacylase/carboxypeptidase family protein
MARYIWFATCQNEGGRSTRQIMKDGLLELFPMEAIFGVHSWPAIGVSQFAIRSGPISASRSEFEILFTARGYSCSCRRTPDAVALYNKLAEHHAAGSLFRSACLQELS